MNIVIVEDSELILAQLLRIFSSHSRINIQGTASTEEQAVEIILASRPDAVLLDLSLSPGSGMRVLERIRQAGSGTRVLILTNNAEHALRQACEILGISGFYDKTTEARQCLEHLFSWLPPLPENEETRLRTLQSMRLLDTPADEIFDNLTRLAQNIADTPMALISLIDKDRQWFLSHIGLEDQETSRSVAFCAYAIMENQLMEVPNALTDDRFRDNPLVVGAPHLRFYAGIPLVLPSGRALGTLCVLDTKARQLTLNQRHALTTLARSVLSEIELRRHIFDLQDEIVHRKKTEAHIQHLSTRDSLTGLINRVTLRNHLEHAIRQATRTKTQIGVLFVDMDHFKLINDTMGHAVGDDALITVAQRLISNLRESDIVARLGGDEFIVLLPKLGSPNEALQVAKKLLLALEVPGKSKDLGLRIEASIGIANFPEHGKSVDELLRHADLAMYQSKKRGGNCVSIFSQHLDATSETTLNLINDLHDALHRDEFVLYFQPQVMLNGSSLHGMEALIRWQHPRLGMTYPNQFIPLAEERRLIHEIGQWVLEKSLAQLAAWDATGVPVPRIAINVSAGELHAGFAEAVEAALIRHCVAPNRLDIEITESILLADGIETLTLLSRLREIGVSIAIDDFGVGYSSLGQLSHFPIDILKIDKCFVDNIHHNETDAAIVSAIVTMAHALGLRTIAEGVETNEQTAKLAALGCQYVQGYFFGRPMPTTEVPTWVASLNSIDEESIYS